ncbi:hypothetical protein CGZ93_10790 [Enemella dayhoffiae]|uniref:Dodecin domain-containing protein n=1 Tax=Enemella dayhoffiae TaxID=2016507 RepID=A0A255H069_9ACTN|nr:dodecin [Enemella dayhoffiae]OYO21159.1 hypothetical protein CGZ93_10790 [Enemella dayhoffiae]
MSEHTYQTVELVGSSPEGVDTAIENAIEVANQKFGDPSWFEVVSTRGHIENGKVGHYQVTLRVGFRLAE